MFPIKPYTYKFPKPEEPGSFGAIRKYDCHTGVDLYCQFMQPVYAIESGLIKRVGHFTGPKVNTPWWNDTDFILIEGKSGCILYGEIQLPSHFIKPTENEYVDEGTLLGYVIPVLKKDKGRPMNMLHIELYEHGYDGDGVVWERRDPRPKQLQDITPLLKREFNRQKPIFRRLLGHIGINI